MGLALQALSGPDTNGASVALEPEGYPRVVVDVVPQPAGAVWAAKQLGHPDPAKRCLISIAVEQLRSETSRAQNALLRPRIGLVSTTTACGRRSHLCCNTPVSTPRGLYM